MIDLYTVFILKGANYSFHAELMRNIEFNCMTAIFIDIDTGDLSSWNICLHYEFQLRYTFHALIDQILIAANKCDVCKHFGSIHIKNTLR